jgi:hypothetical protein
VSRTRSHAGAGYGIVLVGMLLGAALSLGGLAIVRSDADGPPCTPVAAHPGWSVARQWNEVLLDAIRRDLPAPTVHARNLFHTSVAMWDAWAAYDRTASGYLVAEDHDARDVDAAREEAISYAAYRVLSHRYRDAIGASDTLPAFAEVMEDRCLPLDVTTTQGSSPAAVGNRIAARVLEVGRTDGANEQGGYQPPDGYAAVNPPLAVAAPGATMVDPDRWQPLQLENMISQNGIPVAGGVQEFIGPHWGHVAGFALPAGGPEGLPMDPGRPPELHDARTAQAYKDMAVEVIRFSSQLDPTQSPVIDASPASLGGNPLGTNDGQGHAVNPVTGTPYDPNPANAADLYRALAEYWADGPSSETPPGHWHALANAVSDDLAPDLRIGGVGTPVDRLEWDVKLYLALGAANHDAAIVAWGAKGYYDSVRPISMIRYLGGHGQSSDPDGPAYHPDGLPLVPGLIEVVTGSSSAPGGPHEELAGHEGRVAVRSWRGRPEDPDRELGGVGWILAVDWIPYQLPTFVTPAFAGYVSGHSTFSQASAEVLTAITGSPYFPGGLGTHTVRAGAFEFEAGPERDVTLQWATYADAADQAGLSRLYGGIHIAQDDLDGRRVGALCGEQAWALATRYFRGLA